VTSQKSTVERLRMVVNKVLRKKCERKGEEENRMKYQCRIIKLKG
jgi:hypothetical protein